MTAALFLAILLGTIALGMPIAFALLFAAICAIALLLSVGTV